VAVARSGDRENKRNAAVTGRSVGGVKMRAGVTPARRTALVQAREGNAVPLAVL